MTQTITVRPPRNLQAEHNHIFLPLLAYDLKPVIVKELKDAFVGYSGFTLDSTGLVRESHHDYDFQYPEYLREATSYYKLCIADPEKLIHLDGRKTYLQIFHPWFNYGHWLFDSMLRLWLVRARAKNMVLILPDFYATTKFIQESLEPFQFKDIFYIPRQHSVYVGKLCLPQVKPIVDSYQKKELVEIREFLLNYVKEKNLKHRSAGDKIYLSRKKSWRRYVVNEAAVEELLRGHGFVTLFADDLGFFEQVTIFSQAKWLVSIMGAGLSNVMFMQENSSVLEFHKTLHAADVHCKTFWYLADALGFDYYYQFCEPTDPKADVYTADLKVDIVQLKENLALMLRN